MRPRSRGENAPSRHGPAEPRAPRRRGRCRFEIAIILVLTGTFVGSSAGSAVSSSDGGPVLAGESPALAAASAFTVGDIVRGSAQGKVSTAVIVAVSRREDGVPRYTIYQALSTKDGWAVRRFVNGRVTVDALSFSALGPTRVAHVSLADVTVTDPNPDGGDVRYTGRSLADALRGVGDDAGQEVRIPVAVPTTAPAPVASPTSAAVLPLPVGVPVTTPSPARGAVVFAPTVVAPVATPASPFGVRRYVIGAVPDNPPVGVPVAVAKAPSDRPQDLAARLRVASGLKPPTARFQRWSPVERWQAEER